MGKIRAIKQAEIDLIRFLLKHLNLNENEFPIGNEVDEYEDGKMGSISFGDGNPDDYKGDLLQVNYTDSDGIAVLITLTINQQNQLLDLDFWKSDFSKLLRYPKPEELVFG